MVGIRTVGKKGQVTIPKEIREKFGLKEGSKVSFEVKEDEIVIKPEKSGKDFVEEWCSIVKKKLDKPIDLRRLKEEYYEEQVEKFYYHVNCK
ncbi:MAG: AbrB family transcriptional regulator [Candidatus Syntrophoarchaeum caldarius]|uniref:AbrB family transcriptional regulator n=1 Tax=Candidatus Syntropharchaeum caldarium TaxID=1838285 RepID=A0A1F2P9D5_9EURY|nr:MAG: AbrB family transcriptional regulator [Candidatus Syntrophoarchaeum caldarius]